MNKLEWIERYDIRGKDLGGWAVIHIDARGFLGVFSDYGNYAYHWTHFGDDFKKFLSQLHWDYLYGKLMQGRDARLYDGEATLRGIQKRIVELRREGTLTREQAREEWDLAIGSEIDDRYSNGFSVWHRDTQLDDANELYETKNDLQCEQFCQKIWPHFIERLKAGDRCEHTPSGLDGFRQNVLHRLSADWNAGELDADVLLQQAFDRAVAFMQGRPLPWPDSIEAHATVG
jgi:hypothetical protein